jgi:hypothetical protein
MTLAAWTLAISSLVTDAHGWRFSAIPADGADAIADVCARTTVPRHCAAVLVVLAARESGYRLSAIGDGGRSRGAWQTITCRGSCETSWREQAADAWRHVVASASRCAEPLAMYAAGSCSSERGKAISRERMAIARALAKGEEP